MVPLGFAWEGPSAIDGSPIVMVVTGVRNESRNPKTGPMLQVLYLPASVDPRLAVATGQDVGVCGSCGFRPDAGRTGDGDPSGVRCYVRLAEMPLNVWRTWKAGRYIKVAFDGTPADIALWAPWIRGRSVRLGAYGDPLSVSLEVTRRLLSVADSWTGYTHAWPSLGARETRAWSRIVMASANSVADAVRARALGWRTFRIGSDGPAPDGSREIHCPASPESGHLTTCIRCRLCSGTAGRGGAAMICINILPHGNGNRAPVAVPVTMGAVR